MVDSIGALFSTDGFLPHGHCYLWRPEVLWLHVTSDALITLAYFSIPFTLVYFVRRRQRLEFNWMFVCFAVFIVAGGAMHLMEIWTVWHPAYWLSGSVKAVTALASVPTAILLVKLIPDALRQPSPSAPQRASADLIRRADGVFRWFKTRAVPLRDAAGHIVKWFGSNTDFEDYKRSEDRLRTQLARLNLLDRTTRAIGERQDLRSIFQVVIRSLEDHLPEHVDRIPGKPPRLAELRMALAELTVARAFNSLP